MIGPYPDRDHQPANPPMTITVPAAPPNPRAIALELLEELEHISSQAEAVALGLRRLGLSGNLLEQMEPGASVTVQRITCRLESAAAFLRHLHQ